MPPSPTNTKADDPAAATLGQKFFFDTRFSGALTVASDLGAVGDTGKVGCISCHNPGQGGSDHRSNGNTSKAAGFTGRNAPTIYNVAYQGDFLFWDGRKDSAWSQALGPPESGVEHNGTRLQYVQLIRTAYASEYTAVFGALPANLESLPASGMPGQASYDNLSATDKMNVDRVYSNFGKAIEAYERKLIDKNSKFDKFMAGDMGAMSEAAIRGAKVFVKAGCDDCHSGGNFSDGKFHNLGVKQEGSNIPTMDRGRFEGIPKVIGDPFNRNGDFSDSKQSGHLTGLAAASKDDGAFKTPTLRSVSKTAPYMHTGNFATLKDVVNFYNKGGDTTNFSGTKDTLMKPLGLTDAEVTDLVAFLEALEGEPLATALTVKP